MFKDFPATRHMNSSSPTISALNERRRLAVKLRLEGRKLKDICELVDLSSPTIIAAHKQFLEGGWPAVDVKPRGRPTGERATSEAALQELFLQALKTPDHPNSPWTFELLAKRGAELKIQTSARTIGVYLEERGVSTQSLHKLCKSSPHHTEWMDTCYAEITETAKKQNATVYWAGSTTCQPDKSIRTLLYAHSTRGKYFWLLGQYKNDTEQFIEFFNRLKDQSTHSNVVVIWKGPDPATVNGLKQWLEASSDISFYLHPEVSTDKSPVTKTIEESNNAKNAIPEQSPINPQPESSTTDSKEPAMESRVESDSYKETRTSKTMSLNHLQQLEAESIHIMREVIAEAEKPVMLYSIGKDSAVMLHLAKKAFYPAKPPFPLLHVDTGWKFQAMYDFRDQVAKESGMQLIVHKNLEGVEKGVNPFTHGSGLHTDIMKTQALKQALDKHEFDVAFGGARRDEEKSRAKERVLSFRNEHHRWDPKNQRPELWNLYNTYKKKGESIRAFPLSNWTELDIWQYISREDIPVVPLYFAAERPVVLRDGTWIMVDDDRMQLNEGEVPIMKKVRFRTLGCYPLTGAIESNAATVLDVIEEMLLAKNSERQGRMIDHDNAASMEKKKQEGYF